MTPVVHHRPAPYRSHDLSRYDAVRGRAASKTKRAPRMAGPVSASRSARR